jgi:hypothetical protein
MFVWWPVLLAICWGALAPVVGVIAYIIAHHKW